MRHAEVIIGVGFKETIEPDDQPQFFRRSFERQHVTLVSLVEWVFKMSTRNIKLGLAILHK